MSEQRESGHYLVGNNGYVVPSYDPGSWIRKPLEPARPAAFAPPPRLVWDDPGFKVVWDAGESGVTPKPEPPPAAVAAAAACPDCKGKGTIQLLTSVVTCNCRETPARPDGKSPEEYALPRAPRDRTFWISPVDVQVEPDGDRRRVTFKSYSTDRISGRITITADVDADTLDATLNGLVAELRQLLLAPPGPKP